MLRAVLAVIALGAALASLSIAALADDGPRFHRTTPRGSFGREGELLLVGVPGGRAWGIESELLPVPRDPSQLSATIEILDPSVREAFVRVAFYDRDRGRPRQISIVDASVVRGGASAMIRIALDPPANAIAYRVRVLARMRESDALASAGAIHALLGPVAPRVPLTRLLE